MTKRLFWVLLASIILAGGLFALRSAPFLRDDAYIFLRYADNLASGFGFVFNRGGETVEGFSSPLWQAMLTGAAALFGKGRLETATLILGFGVYVLAMAALLRRSAPPTDATAAGGRRFASLVPLSLLACLPTTASYALSGLEPFLFLTAVLCFNDASEDPVSVRLRVFVGLLAMWIRPEGLWLPVSYAAMCIGRGEVGRIFSRPALMSFGAVAVGAAILSGLRYSIFDVPLPNTYYAKEPSYVEGVTYVWTTYTRVWGGAVLLLGLLGALFGERRHRGYFAAGVSWVLAVILEGGDWMSFGRFLLPANALFLVASTGLFDVDVAKVWGRFSFSPRNRLAVAGLLFVAGAAVNVDAALDAGNQSLTAARTHSRANATLAKWFTDAGIKSLGTIDIGQIGFLSPLEILDFGGLTDATIGRVPGRHFRKPLDLDYVFETRRPDVICIRIYKPPTLHPDGAIEIDPRSASSLVEGAIWLAPRFRERYEMLFVNVPGRHITPYYSEVFFLRRDVRIDPALMPTKKIIYHDVGERAER